MTYEKIHGDLNHQNYLEFTNKIQKFFNEEEIKTKNEKAFKENKLKIENDLLTVLMNRKSTRNFSGDSISKEILDYLLYYSKFYPSAGDLRSLKIGIIINNVNEVENGVYLYDDQLDDLIPLRLLNAKEFIQTANLQHSNIIGGNAVLFIISKFNKVEKKYGTRGYRFINLEAGHLQHNICLLSESVGIKHFICGGYFDHKYKDLFDLDEDEIILSQIVIGT